MNDILIKELYYGLSELPWQDQYYFIRYCIYWPCFDILRSRTYRSFL